MRRNTSEPFRGRQIQGPNLRRGFRRHRARPSQGLIGDGATSWTGRIVQRQGMEIGQSAISRQAKHPFHFDDAFARQPSICTSNKNQSKPNATDDEPCPKDFLVETSIYTCLTVTMWALGWTVLRTSGLMVRSFADSPRCCPVIKLNSTNDRRKDCRQFRSEL